MAPHTLWRTVKLTPLSYQRLTMFKTQTMYALSADVSFEITRSFNCQFNSKDLPNFSEICLEADQNLFRKVLHNPEHVLHQLLLPVSASTRSYSLRTRAHNRQLPDRLSHSEDCNFIIRMLFYQSY